MIVSYSKYKKLCENRNYIVEKFSHEIDTLKAENEELKTRNEGLKGTIQLLEDVAMLDALQRMKRGELEKLNEPPELKFIELKVRENTVKIYEECIEKIKALFPSDNEPYQYWEIHEGADNILNEAKKNYKI